MSQQTTFSLDKFLKEPVNVYNLFHFIVSDKEGSLKKEFTQLERTVGEFINDLVPGKINEQVTIGVNGDHKKVIQLKEGTSFEPVIILPERLETDKEEEESLFDQLKAIFIQKLQITNHGLDGFNFLQSAYVKIILEYIIAKSSSLVTKQNAVTQIEIDDVHNQVLKYHMSNEAFISLYRMYLPKVEDCIRNQGINMMMNTILIDQYDEFEVDGKVKINEDCSMEIENDQLLNQMIDYIVNCMNRDFSSVICQFIQLLNTPSCDYTFMTISNNPNMDPLMFSNDYKRELRKMIEVYIVTMNQNINREQRMTESSAKIERAVKFMKEIMKQKQFRVQDILFDSGINIKRVNYQEMSQRIGTKSILFMVEDTEGNVYSCFVPREEFYKKITRKTNDMICDERTFMTIVTASGEQKVVPLRKGNRRISFLLEFDLTRNDTFMGYDVEINHGLTKKTTLQRNDETINRINETIVIGTFVIKERMNGYQLFVKESIETNEPKCFEVNRIVVYHVEYEPEEVMM